MSHVTHALKIVALGGLGEVGMNCLVIESARAGCSCSTAA